jgi:tetratricopeptide (TPR) repeat protein
VSSPWDLTKAPTPQYVAFRKRYASAEHFLRRCEPNESVEAAVSTSPDVSVEPAAQASVAQYWDEPEHLRTRAALNSIAKNVRHGFRAMESAVSWGFARVCWQHEQDRRIYHEILDTLKHPLETQALEHRERAESAIKNSWWEEAVGDLLLALENNRYDFLAHLQLGRVLWFEFGRWDPAMEHFQLAAKYADAVEVDEKQKYYAALAHLHVALLWRMDAEAGASDRDRSLSNAATSGIRAVELTDHRLSIALLECALDLLEADRARCAIAALQHGVENSETLLLAIEANPELMAWGKVRVFVDFWRQSQPVEEMLQISKQAEVLVKEYWPEAWQETVGLRRLRSDPRSAGVLTRLVLTEVTRDLTQAFSHVREKLSDCDDLATEISSIHDWNTFRMACGRFEDI